MNAPFSIDRRDVSRRDETLGTAALVAATLAALCWGLAGCTPTVPQAAPEPRSAQQGTRDGASRALTPPQPWMTVKPASA